MFSVRMHTTPGIDWYTLVYNETLHIKKTLLSCIPNNMSKHQPRIIKFPDNNSYENSSNAMFTNIEDKSNSELEKFMFIYEN